ncbi:hypothetical protein EVAR_32234_1 [Eumeta japonica]|uniref:Uncharacterized protein n=1 Tax=Eumeta variegata TaxID=151549 RepID=A0A4C1YLN1_EUMVA|nr:hypothetical protein EVAR_32234_1 [Eumeta japonica]
MFLSKYFERHLAKLLAYNIDSAILLNRTKSSYKSDCGSIGSGGSGGVRSSKDLNGLLRQRDPNLNILGNKNKKLVHGAVHGQFQCSPGFVNRPCRPRPRGGSVLGTAHFGKLLF